MCVHTQSMRLSMYLRDTKTNLWILNEKLNEQKDDASHRVEYGDKHVDKLCALFLTMPECTLHGICKMVFYHEFKLRAIYV